VIRIFVAAGTQGASLQVEHGLEDGSVPFGVARSGFTGTPTLLPFTAGDAHELPRKAIDAADLVRFRTVDANGAAVVQSAPRTLDVITLEAAAVVDG
jgi:hypothetical protein